MFSLTNLKNKNIAILGWGVDTSDCVPWLLAQGAKVTVYDRKTIDLLPDLAKEAEKLTLKLGSDEFKGLQNFDLIIRNPAIYRYRSEIVAADKAGVPIYSKTKLFFDLCPAKIIGVTGTKGKGTTSTLIYEILKKAGKEVYLGGNIGQGVFDFLDKLTPESFVILELSSFQLIDLHKSPHIAVVLMVTSEHLDWHKDTDEYVTAKSQLVLHQTDGDFVVANKDYLNSVKIAKQSDGKIVWISKDDVKGIKTSLRGQHNLENIAAAVSVAKILNLKYKSVVANFKGLEHRLEEVKEVKGVKFYNDSFSTVPETAVAAIKAFNEPEILILGGSSKNSDFTELGKVIDDSKNIRLVICIGQEGQKIANLIKKQKVLLVSGNMEKIVQIAYNNATNGDVVVLSPACASFDMFKNYKDRGQQFKQAVNKL